MLRNGIKNTTSSNKSTSSTMSTLSSISALSTLSASSVYPVEDQVKYSQFQVEQANLKYKKRSDLLKGNYTKQSLGLVAR